MILFPSDAVQMIFVVTALLILGLATRVKSVRKHEAKSSDKRKLKNNELSILLAIFHK